MYAINMKNNKAATAGHMLVSTNNGVLCNDAGGLEGPKVFVKVNPTSSEMYVVAAKKIAAKTDNGIKALGVPSSTTWVDMIA